MASDSQSQTIESSADGFGCGLPIDIWIVVATTVLVNLVVLAPVVNERPLRMPIGIAFLLFVPGYVLIAAAIPGRRTGDKNETVDRLDERTWVSESGAGMDTPERAVLAVVLSVAIVPLIAAATTVTPWGLTARTVIVGLTVYTIIATAIAVVRRRSLAVNDQFRLPIRTWTSKVRTAVFSPDTRGDAALTVILALAVLLAIGSFGYAIAGGPADEQYSSVSLLMETEDGNLVTDDYPDELTTGESSGVVVGIDNHEHRTVDYTVVAVEQEVDDDGAVPEQRELDRFEATVEHGDTAYQEFELEPTMTGDDRRMVWLLYADEVPASPTTANADQTVHLWIDVEAPDGSE